MILVTGGGGFLGKAIVERLLALGERVRILQRRPQAELQARGVDVVQADLGDAEAVATACHGCGSVFHVAAKAGVWGHVADYERSNVAGTRHVLAGCRLAGVRQLLYTSSPSVVFDGTDEDGIDESVPYPDRHLNAYSATKARAEAEILTANGDDLHTVALRPHLIWGPDDPHLLPR
ncbi:MAG: NAD-dependent epimerase/dehydratase family protein, partial [Planctomycetota bacterium]